MGGRGASSSVKTGSKSLERYLGKKGNPVPIEESLATINDYDRGKEYQYNCQSCATSFEATQRGYDVQSRPHAPNDPYFADENGKQHFWYDVYDAKPKEIYNDAYYKMQQAVENGDIRSAYSFRAKAHGFNALESTKVFNTANQVEKEMKTYGDGSRATLQVKWKGGGAHIMNVVNKGGQVFCADAQTGKTYYLKDVLARTRKGVALTRVDNLKFNSNIQYLTKKKGE